MPETSEVVRLRIDEKLLRMAQKQAKAEHRTLASLIRYLLDIYCKRGEA
jgi:hypothetical protein